MAPQMALEDSLARLDELLAQREAELWATLNPPVTEMDLLALRGRLDPYELHPELVTLLHWHDGQTDRRYNESAWPLIECGPLLRAREACEFLDMGALEESIEVGTWSASWVPLTAVRHSVAAVEMAKPLDGLVIDACFGDPKPTPRAQSIAALMQSILILVEEGFPLRAEPGADFNAQQWLEREDLVRPFRTVYGQHLMRDTQFVKNAGLA